MEKTLDTPLMEGDEVVAVLMLAPGPAALAPAQATQFSHPLILWIWLLTVWADERSEDGRQKEQCNCENGHNLGCFIYSHYFYSRGFVCCRHFQRRR